MGGKTFDNTNRLNLHDFNRITELIKVSKYTNYLLPFRLGNKVSHGDYDLIVYETDKYMKLFEDINLVKEIKIIPLFEKRFGLCSKHILTTEQLQIDFLMPWSNESLEITRVFFSYSFANVFLKRFIDIIHRNLQLSYLGVFCSSNKFKVPDDVKYIRIDKQTRLIIDCEYIFELIDLDYSEYKKGFKNEIKLLEFFEKSKYYKQIVFKNVSKFKHDYSRLKPFKNLVDLGLIKVENFIHELN